MKRLLAATLLVGALLPQPARAQTVGGYYNDNVEAQANWIAGRSNGNLFFRFIHVGRYTNPIGARETLVEVGKVLCTAVDRARSFQYDCRIRARLLEVRGSNFEFDPLARSAQVRFKQGGVMSAVEWAAKQSHPNPGWSLEGGERSMAATAHLKAAALVEGTVNGQRFSNQHRKAFASMRRWSEAAAIYEATNGQTFKVEAEGELAARRALRARIASL